MNEIVTARNVITRKVGQYKRRLVDHPVLGKFLEEVPFGTKSFVPLVDLVREHVALPDPEEDEYEAPDPEKEED